VCFFRSSPLVSSVFFSGQAIDYIKKYLGAPTGVDFEELRAENDDLKKRNAELQRQVGKMMLL
jgi:hypothetical protein